MRIYQVTLDYEKVVIHADEIEFKKTFERETTKESLVFFQGKRLVGIFKSWYSIIDLGEYIPEETCLQANENELL